ncbi:ras guanine nucleotide exchange factor domain-containing protein [Blakeslea trispora]|nr:ras guanine nucleotide exchange factor domain-containing protein [Blakeslea trispora]
MKPDLSKRRSKSLDDIVIIQKDQEESRLSCYQDTPTPTSPIIELATQHALVKRRHSLCAELNTTEYLRMATIYGWVTMTRKLKSMKESDDSQHGLYASQSFSNLPVMTTKLSKRFANKTPSTTSSSPLITSSLSLPLGKTTMHEPNLENTIDLFDDFPYFKQEPDHLYISQKLPNLQKKPVEKHTPPSTPIENDPHIFDLLAVDAGCFIHYGRSDDTTLTSAIVEKLVEKLTREMDNEFLMDFFLTFRQFITPIKLCKLLILRFRWTLLQETDEHRLIRIRTFVVIRHWLTHYWACDFATSRTLRFMLSTFLTQLQGNRVILASPRDEHIIKSLRHVFKRQRKLHQTSNDYKSYRKDSAIGITPCHASLQSPPPSPAAISLSSTLLPPSVVDQHTNWASKMKSSIRRTVSKTPNQKRIPSSIVTSHPFVSSCDSVSPEPSSSSSSSTVSHFLSYLAPSISSSLSPPSPASASRYHPYQQSSHHYKSIVLKYRSEIIAQQFCLIEQAMLQNITWEELVELRWRKRSSKRQSFVVDMAALSQEADINQLGVDRMIAYFNVICQWVASEIVRSQQMEIRTKVIEKFIRISLKCYQHRNYSTMMQILLGLQSPAVSRLEKTWQKVNHGELELFNQLKEMAKPFRNWKNVRDRMTEAVEEIAEPFAVESVLTQSQAKLDSATQGCIPFLGLYLSDLVFVAELPTFIQSSCPKKKNHDDQGSSYDKALCDKMSHRLVNYNKFRITASVVKHVLSFQVLSRAYQFKIHPELHQHLQSMSLLDNAQIRKASFLCEAYSNPNIK